MVFSFINFRRFHFMGISLLCMENMTLLREMKCYKNLQKKNKHGWPGMNKLKNAWYTWTKWSTFTSHVFISLIQEWDTLSQSMQVLRDFKLVVDFKFSCKCFDHFQIKKLFFFVNFFFFVTKKKMINKNMSMFFMKFIYYCRKLKKYNLVEHSIVLNCVCCN